jgi:hypothetical protein
VEVIVIYSIRIFPIAQQTFAGLMADATGNGDWPSEGTWGQLNGQLVKWTLINREEFGLLVRTTAPPESDPLTVMEDDATREYFAVARSDLHDAWYLVKGIGTVEAIVGDDLVDLDFPAVRERLSQRDRERGPRVWETGGGYRFDRWAHSKSMPAMWEMTPLMFDASWIGLSRADSIAMRADFRAIAERWHRPTTQRIDQINMRSAEARARRSQGR